MKKTWSVPVGPFADHKILHHYHRIEFQNRGSPHAHMMLWLENANILIPGDDMAIKNVIEFVDKIISCDSDEIDNDLIALQTLSHMPSKT